MYDLKISLLGIGIQLFMGNKIWFGQYLIKMSGPEFAEELLIFTFNFKCL